MKRRTDGHITSADVLHRNLCDIYAIYGGKIFNLLNKKKRVRVLEDQRGFVKVCD